MAIFKGFCEKDFNIFFRGIEDYFAQEDITFSYDVFFKICEDKKVMPQNIDKLFLRKHFNNDQIYRFSQFYNEKGLKLEEYKYSNLNIDMVPLYSIVEVKYLNELKKEVYLDLFFKFLLSRGWDLQDVYIDEALKLFHYMLEHKLKDYLKDNNLMAQDIRINELNIFLCQNV